MNSWDIIKEEFLINKSPASKEYRLALIKATKIYKSLREKLRDKRLSDRAFCDDGEALESLL